MSYKILYASDLHGNKELYNKLIDKAKEKEIKAVVIGGDLCPKGSHTIEESILNQKNFLNDFFIPEFAKLKKDVFIIMGNDDFRVNERILQQENKNIKYINKKRYSIFSKNIVGYGFVNPNPFRLKDWEKPEDGKKEIRQFDGEIRTVEAEGGNIEEDLNNFKKLSYPEKTIYVIHAPPFNTKLDIITNGIHVGSRAVRKFIEKEQPFLTLHGHIHESPEMSGSWIDNINKTICINIGSHYLKNELKFIVIDLSNLDVKYMEI